MIGFIIYLVFPNLLCSSYPLNNRKAPFSLKFLPARFLDEVAKIELQYLV